jgi:hypothetical protein
MLIKIGGGSIIFLPEIIFGQVETHHSSSWSISLPVNEIPGSVDHAFIVLFQGADQIIVLYVLIFNGIIAFVRFAQGRPQFFEYRISQAIVLVLKEVFGLFKTGLGIVKIFGLLCK